MLLLLLDRTAYRPGQVQCLIKMQNVDTFPSCKKFFAYVNVSMYVCMCVDFANLLYVV